jgi:hypothetical protein
MEQRIWHDSASSIDARIAEARQLAYEHQPSATNRDLIRLALGRQMHLLHITDTESLTTSQLTAQQIALCMLESPFAAEAQAAQNDGPAKNAAERARRVGALSQFNHDFAAAVSYMPPSMTERFPSAFLHRTQALAQKLQLPAFSESDIRRIAAGMSREVAFARALRQNMPEDWSYRHATTTEDLQGIDVIITNDQGTNFNIDLKTQNAFVAVLEKLVEKGRLSIYECEIALKQGYANIVNGNERTGYVKTCLVDADQFGAIKAFEYEDSSTVMEFVEARFDEQQQTLRTLGGHAINS